jgi:hypothetical protein
VLLEILDLPLKNRAFSDKTIFDKNCALWKESVFNEKTTNKIVSFDDCLAKAGQKKFLHTQNTRKSQS